MKLQKLKKLELFKNEELLNLEKLPIQGFCNINYKLSSSTNNYLIRVFKSNDSVNISRDFEYKIQKKAWKKKIASKPLYMDKEKTFMVTQFLEGIHKEILTKNDLKEVLKQVKKLHKIKTSNKVYDIKKDLKNYSKILKDTSSKKLIQKAQKELKKVQKYKKNYVTTHHDLNPKNMIFHKNSVKFIDWEYTGVNDCFFDLATICVEFKLSNKMKKLLLKNYFLKEKKEYKICLNSYTRIYENICKLWFKTLK